MLDLSRQYPLSIGFLRGEIKRGSLRARRFGRRVLVLKEDWDSYIQTADGAKRRVKNSRTQEKPKHLVH